LSPTEPHRTDTGPAAHRPAGGAAAARDTFTIRDLGREFGVTARTLRYYEERGLLNPARHGENRLYSRRDRARLAYVLKGKSIGFSLDDVRDLLDLYDHGDGGVTQLKAAKARFEERIAQLRDQRLELDRMIADLETASAETGRKLERALAREHDPPPRGERE
jgi:DNA-binding transcriptional MerR regulator